jgi:tRNA A-37 threonylcarbamoyl transferase component Bud32
VTIPSSDDSRDLNLNKLTWKDLHAAHFAFDSPFQLDLADGQVFFAERIVRLVPKRRLVAFGTWQGQPVAAKLFFDSHHAKRQGEKDLAGIKSLQENKIPTPALRYQGISKDKRIYVLLFQRLFNSKNLEEIWREKENIEDMLPLLKSVIIELATQHVLGVLQHDLHLKNFLLAEKTNLIVDGAEIEFHSPDPCSYKDFLQAEKIIYTLDGGEVELFPYLLPKKLSINSLALFFSQLGVGIEKYQERLLHYYAKSRGWILKKDDVIDLFIAVKKWNEQRWRRFEKKIFRNCTDFVRVQDGRTVGMVDRRYRGPEFSAFLTNPDALFTHSKAKSLKVGRSSTVIKVTLDSHELVIKRYNMKNLWHRLRRCLRLTRAFTSWRLAQKLSLFDIATAKPVAFIEKRFLGCRGKSYYVTEYISGEHAVAYFVQNRAQEEKTTEMIKRLTTLLKNTAKLDITHGDLKMTNILINANDYPVLIDLDGAIEHASLSSLDSAWRKEIKRFLQNFHDQPTVRDRFTMEFNMKLRKS